MCAERRAQKSAEAAKTLEFLQEQLPLIKNNVDTSEAASRRSS